MKPVRVADGGLSREAETVETRSARSADRLSRRTKTGKRDGASKKKEKNPRRKTGKKKGNSGSERKEKDKKGEKEGKRKAGKEEEAVRKKEVEEGGNGDGDESKARLASKTLKGSFGDFRKYKEDIINIVSACSKPLNKQKEKAKALGENVNSMKAAQGAVASLTGSGGRRFFKDRFSFNSTFAFFINQNQVTSRHTNRLCWFHHGCPAGHHPGRVKSRKP